MQQLYLKVFKKSFFAVIIMITTIIIIIIIIILLLLYGYSIAYLFTFLPFSLPPPLLP